MLIAPERKYPRHLRLGLIEAGAGAKGLFLNAGYPRHLRLGLIEAGGAWRLSLPS